MEKLQWDTGWSLGIAELDDQHRILSDLVNTLHGFLEQKQDDEKVAMMLHRLIEYGAAHFSAEEQLMVGSGFPDFEEHRLEHNRFIKTVADFTEDLAEGRGDVVEKAVEFIHDWFFNHVDKTDRRFVPYLKKPPV